MLIIVIGGGRSPEQRPADLFLIRTEIYANISVVVEEEEDVSRFAEFDDCFFVLFFFLARD